MGGKRKIILPLPAGFPEVGEYVSYYDEGWRHGYLRSIIGGRTAVIERFIGRDVKVPVGDVEIPEKKGELDERT